MDVGTMLVPIVMPVGVMTLGYAVIRDGPIDCRTRIRRAVPRCE